jgi:hypothetical protein
VNFFFSLPVHLFAFYCLQQAQNQTPEAREDRKQLDVEIHPH